MKGLSKGVCGLFKPEKCLNVELQVSRFNLQGGHLSVRGPRRSLQLHGAGGCKRGRLPSAGTCHPALKREAQPLALQWSFSSHDSLHMASGK